MNIKKRLVHKKQSKKDLQTGSGRCLNIYFRCLSSAVKNKIDAAGKARFGYYEHKDAFGGNAPGDGFLRPTVAAAPAVRQKRQGRRPRKNPVSAI